MDAAITLVRARQQAGLSQRGLARRAGTSAAAVCLYESGRRVPRVDTLTRLVAATGSTLSVRLTAPAAIDHLENGRVLEALLELADHLPRRFEPELAAPVFAHLADSTCAP